MTRRLVKRETIKQDFGSRMRSSHVAIVVCQHCLLWSTLYVVAGTAYLLAIGAISKATLPSAVVLLVASATSVLSLSLHILASCLAIRTYSDSRADRLRTVQSMAKSVIRFAVTAWMAACGLAITFTAARQPFCLISESAARFASPLDVGVTCMVQRASIAASLVAMIATIALFICITKVQEPFRCHLLGVSRDPALLPLVLPYQAQNQPKYSEMSFKCRSSASLSISTLVASHESSCDSLYKLYPTRPEKAYGLGIYAPPATFHQFLTPRPSLSTIRSCTTIGSAAPPDSPLPPLPTYNPEKHRKHSAVQKTIQPPRRPYRPDRRQSDRSLRLVAPSPALSTANLAAFNKSTESLSSVYSRAISESKQRVTQPIRPSPLSEAGRSLSSSSTATLKRSPLEAMRLATDSEKVVLPKPQLSTGSVSSDSSIDDVATLHAKVLSARSFADLGETKVELAPEIPHRSLRRCTARPRIKNGAGTCCNSFAKPKATDRASALALSYMQATV